MLHDVQLPSCMTRNMLIGMRLAQIRQSRELSQEALAAMIGKDKSTISRAEKMSKTAKLETYILCAKVLGVTLADIFVASEAEAILIKAYRASEGPAREMLMGMAERAATLPPEPHAEATPSDAA